MYDLLKSQKQVNVRFFDGYWLDIGRPDDYKKAIDVYSEQRERFLG